MILRDKDCEVWFASQGGGPEPGLLSGIVSIRFVPPPDHIPPSRFDLGEPRILLGDVKPPSPMFSDPLDSPAWWSPMSEKKALLAVCGPSVSCSLLSISLPADTMPGMEGCESIDALAG
jgi:hypothetical protein